MSRPEGRRGRAFPSQPRPQERSGHPESRTRWGHRSHRGLDERALHNHRSQRPGRRGRHWGLGEPRFRAASMTGLRKPGTANRTRLPAGSRSRAPQAFHQRPVQPRTASVGLPFWARARARWRMPSSQNQASPFEALVSTERVRFRSGTTAVRESRAARPNGRTSSNRRGLRHFGGSEAVSGGKSGVGIFPLTARHLAPAVGGERAGGGVRRQLGEEPGEIGGGADETCSGCEGVQRIVAGDELGADRRKALPVWPWAKGAPGGRGMSGSVSVRPKGATTSRRIQAA